MGVGGDLGATAGSAIGRWAGNSLQHYLGFKKGGHVKGKKGKPIMAIVHGGEYVLPVGVHPTPHQRAEVAKRHKKRR